MFVQKTDDRNSTASSSQVSSVWPSLVPKEFGYYNLKILYEVREPFITTY